MLATGEAALAGGGVEEAARQFERAGMVKHEADAELGLIRTYMQAGEYRRALSFAAHTAGAHPNSGAGSALYVWLLHIGGQVQIAAQLLDNARARLPADAVLHATASLIKSPLSEPPAALLVPPARFAPYISAATPPLPRAAVVIASGALVDGGRSVLTCAAALGKSRHVWVRNGLGQTVSAKRTDKLNDTGLAHLELSDAIAAPELLLFPARDPFPGSPGFAVEFPVIANVQPGWPLLRVGFLGKPVTMGVYQLGINMPPSSPRGGPVFDTAGHMIGIAVSSPTADDRLILASELRKHLNAVPGDPAPGTPRPRVGVDEIYERALKMTVQVIAEP